MTVVPQANTPRWEQGDGAEVGGADTGVGDPVGGDVDGGRVSPTNVGPGVGGAEGSTGAATGDSVSPTLERLRSVAQVPKLPISPSQPMSVNASPAFPVPGSP